MKLKKTIIKSSAYGIEIVLDASQIFPGDPGMGTPAIVKKGRHTATFHCALDTGELGLGDYTLTKEESDWLASKESEVDAFMEEYS